MNGLNATTGLLECGRDRQTCRSERCSEGKTQPAVAGPEDRGKGCEPGMLAGVLSSGWEGKGLEPPLEPVEGTALLAHWFPSTEASVGLLSCRNLRQYICFVSVH